MLDWRTLLDTIGIEWIDKGKNTQRGNVNIACPFCGDDPSYHLAISENIHAYYCYRDPSHAGYNLRKLLVQLGVSYAETTSLLNSYNSDVEPEIVKKQAATAAEAAWQHFEQADTDPRYRAYLIERGFIAPISVARQYDLRFAPYGKWAMRLLIPVTENGHVITWIGRDITDSLKPKYRAEPIEHPGYLYVPRMPREILVITEGSIDALKIAVATDGEPISSVALLGKNMNNARLERLGALAKGCKRVLLALDKDVPDIYRWLYAISHAVSPCPVEQLTVPYGYNDPGAMPLTEINSWIRGKNE